MDKEYIVTVGFLEADGKEWKAGETYKGSDERIAELIKDARIGEKPAIMKLWETGFVKPA